MAVYTKLYIAYKQVVRYAKTNNRQKMKSKQYLIIFLFTCIQISVFGQINLKISRPKEDILLKELTQHNANVLDYEFIFSKQEALYIDSLILDFKKKTSIEIALVTLGEYYADKEDFDDYTLGLANTWNINNGILIAISKQFRQMRIQNSIEIEKVLSDEETKKIIDNYYIPKFKKGNYFEGTKNGLIALISTLQKKRQKYDSANILTDRIINLIEQNDKQELLQLSTEKIYCYLCFDETPIKQEPFIDKKTFYSNYFSTIFNKELLTRLKRNEKQIFISSENDSAIMVLYTTYRNNEFGDGHEGAQFVFWLKKENNELKINGLETIP